MFKYFFIIVTMFFSQTASSSQKNLHDFTIESIEGEIINLKDYKNKVVLLVNTASKCGFTPQYSGLQKIYDRYKEDGLVVLGVPSNDFNQELSNDNEVKQFCEIRFGVNFPMTKIQKIRGENAHPVYKWISENISIIGTPRWNFHKYLIGRSGEVLDQFPSHVAPTSPVLHRAIKQALSD